jgi:hypothetical protein
MAAAIRSTDGALSGIGIDILKPKRGARQLALKLSRFD